MSGYILDELALSKTLALQSVRTVPSMVTNKLTEELTVRRWQVSKPQRHLPCGEIVAAKSGRPKGSGSELYPEMWRS